MAAQSLAIMTNMVAHLPRFVLLKSKVLFGMDKLQSESFLS